MIKLLKDMRVYPAFGREVFFLFLLSVLLFLLVFFLFFLKKTRLSQVFFITMMLLGSVYSFVLMPLSAPDEVLHYVGAYELSSKMLGTPKPLYDHDGNLRIRKEDTEIDDWSGDNKPNEATVFGMFIQREQILERQEAGFFAKEGGYGYTLQKPVSTTPFAYFFPALGFSFARLISASRFTLLYFGRFFNLLFFAFMGAIAIEKMPFGREMLFSISLFPMTLELVSSLSYDTFILALSFVLLSIVLDYQHREEKLGLKEIGIICLLAVLLSPCKMIYSMLFASCVVVSYRRFSSPLLYFFAIFAVGLSIVLGVLLVNFDSFSRYLRPQADTVNVSDVVGDGIVQETYNRRETFAQPDVFVKILRNTFMIKGKEYLLTMVGNPLGQFDTRVSFPEGLCYLFLLFPFATAILGEKKAIRKKTYLNIAQRTVFLLLSVGLVLVTLTMMLFAYTPKRTDYVLGVQGRYFIPVLPFFILSLVPLGLRGKKGEKLARGILLFQILANLVFCIYTYCTLFQS